MPRTTGIEVANELGCPLYLLVADNPDSKNDLTVILKGTFAFDTAGKVVWAGDQIPVAEWDEYDDPNNPKVVRFECDLVPLKPRTDVVLVGKARASEGRAVKELLVTLRVGWFANSIKVFGNRRWIKTGSLLSRLVKNEPEPFTEMELTYQRAFGGVDCDENWKGEWSDENPVGIGFIAQGRIKEAEGKPLPNLEDPANLIREWSDRPAPVGFGFYGRGWKPRVLHAGATEGNSMELTKSHQETACSSDFFNAAHPRLQYPGYLSGSEEVELVNLVANRPCISFSLPEVRPLVTVAVCRKVQRDSVSVGCSVDRPVPVYLDTLCFMPDECKFYQVWRCQETIGRDEKVTRVRVGLA